ncbi:29953_t:CDS:2, partial [Gigaspora margarita]
FHESASSANVVEEAQVNAFPTFVFFTNRVEIERLVESNDGVELISIPFNQAIDLHSIKIVPKYIAIRETPKLEFIQAIYENNTIIPLRSIRFQKVANIVLYIKNNIGNMDTTVIKELISYRKHLISPLISEKIRLQRSSMNAKA